MLENLGDAILALGVSVLLFAALAYLAYMVGLILVLRRLRCLTWQAFVPVLNYYAQIRAINGPRRWFFISLVPYVGSVYSAAVAIRLGRIFGRSTAFSLTWLIFGAPIGMFVLARSKIEPDWQLLSEPAELVDLASIKREPQK